MADFRDKARFPDSKAIRANDAKTALLVSVDGRDVWFPQLAIDDDSEIWEAGQEGELVVSQRIAEEKGLV